MKQFYLGIVVFAGLITSSCNLINPEERQPCYIQVDTIGVTTDLITQGSNAAKISEAWIYVDDNLIGIYDLPCRVPVLADQGEHKVTVGAGIQINGLSALLAPYAFYRLVDTTITLNPGETSIYNPVVNYYESLTFPLLASFDILAGNKLVATNNSDTSAFLTTNPLEVFEGTASFYANLKQDSGFVEFETVESYVLPKQGKTVYAELNYKNTHVISVGISANYPASSTIRNTVISLRPTETWKKVYVNLTSFVSTEVNASNYKLFFYADKVSGTPELKIYLDNLKIVY
jgi:hypothetical protein